MDIDNDIDVGIGIGGLPPMAQQVKNLSAMQELWVQSLGQEVPLEEGMATHSSILAWRISQTEEPGGLWSIGSQRAGRDWSDLAGMHAQSAVHHASLSFNISQSLLKLMSIDSMMPSNHLILCHHLLLLPSICPSIQVFSNESHQEAKVLELQFHHQSFQWISRTDFL